MEMKFEMKLFGGIEIVEGPELMRKEQIRKHRKKRINKKWRKRYGFRLYPDLYCYMYRDTNNCMKVIAHPKVAQKLRDEMAKSGNTIF